jgi:hypothetical protein
VTSDPYGAHLRKVVDHVQQLPESEQRAMSLLLREIEADAIAGGHKLDPRGWEPIHSDDPTFIWLGCEECGAMARVRNGECIEDALQDPCTGDPQVLPR